MLPYAPRNDDADVEDYGNKWSLGAMLRYLRSNGRDTAGRSHIGHMLVFSGGYITRSITFNKFEVVKKHFDDESVLKFSGIKFIFTLMWLLFR